MSNLKQEFEKFGRVWLRNVIPIDELDRLKKSFPDVRDPGARVKIASPLHNLIIRSKLTDKVKSLWPDMKPVRLVTFDKSPNTNWGLPWHQDRVIALNRKHEVDGFSNWSKKAEIWHCEPPVKLLEKMLFVRLHLDETTIENGAMEIALKSHLSGLVPGTLTKEVVNSCDTEVTNASPGDVLVLAMLTLHRSLPSATVSRRRVLRIDYCAEELPSPLSWVY